MGSPSGGTLNDSQVRAGGCSITLVPGPRNLSRSWLVGWSWLVLWLRPCRCVQECRDLFGGQRGREVPALPGVAAEFTEPGELCCCFDGFGGDRQAQDVGELNEDGQQVAVGGLECVVGAAGDEVAGKFEGVHGQLAAG